MKKPNKKIILSVVALILVLMTTIGFTYAWIDDIKLVEFQNDNLVKNGAPLKTGIDINSDVTITKDNNSIQLGNILDQSTDLTYMYQPTDPVTKEQLSERPHAKYEGAGSGKEPQWNDVGDQLGINSKKGYFYESGGMHLSPCYSDGETFYFKRQNQDGYREGNKDDENVNYISFTAKVSSPDANVDFWFGDNNNQKNNTFTLPTVTDKSGNVLDNARFAIVVDGKSHVYYSPSNSGNTNHTTHTISGGQIVSVPGARKTSAFTFNHPDNNSADRGVNGNTLFSIKKGETVNLTVKVWLEGNVDVEETNVNLSLVSSWAFTQTITIDDKTTAKGASSWIGDPTGHPAKLFFTLPDVLAEMNKKKNNNSTDPNLWSTLVTHYDYAPFYELVRSGNSYTVEIPMIYKNENMVLYRCTDKGWNRSDHTEGDDPQSRGPENYKVTCWNWWQTYIPDSLHEETYTIYGSSYDKTATDRFGGTATNKGYGTWGGVIEITFDGYTKSIGDNNKYGGTNHPNLASSGGDSNTFVRDYSDFGTSGDVYTYIMYNDGNVWKTYVPASSTKIQFYYYLNEDTRGYWGYYSWTGNNLQTRPASSYTYYATQNVDHNDKNIHHQGVGFWEGADTVYLIANGTMQGKTPSDNMWYSSKSSTVSAGTSSMGATSEKYHDGDKEYIIYKTNKTNDQTPAHYYRVKFSDGQTGDGHESSEKVLFPGCYFDWENNCWLGGISGDIRGDGEASDGDITQDDDDTTGTTEILTNKPTEDGVYLYGKLSGGASESEYAKFSTSGNGGKVVLKFKNGMNYSIKVFKKQGSTETTYANEQYNAQSPFSIGTKTSTWNLSKSHSQKVAFFPNADGYFIAEISSIDGNDAKLNWEYKASIN